MSFSKGHIVNECVLSVHDRMAQIMDESEEWRISDIHSGGLRRSCHTSKFTLTVCTKLQRPNDDNCRGGIVLD